MSDTEREALARLLRAVAAVEKMLPHGPDRYELLVAAQAIAAALAAEREAAEARVAEQAREIERLRAGLQEDLAYHEQQTAAWGDPEAGDPDERDHHQRRVDVLRAALEAGR